MFEDKFDYTLQVLVSIAIALLGGIARVSMTKSNDKMTGRDFIQELFVSMFAGLMVFFIVPNKEEWGFAVAGMAGFTAPYTLNFLATKFRMFLEGGRPEVKQVEGGQSQLPPPKGGGLPNESASGVAD